jgi:isochorismate hydrolase
MGGRRDDSCLRTRATTAPLRRGRFGGGVVSPRAIPPVESYLLPGASDLPANIAPWSVDASRAALLVHDMQRFFLRVFPDTPRRALVDNCAQLRDRCRRLGVPIAYTAQPGSMTPSQRGLLNVFWGPGMSGDAADRALVPELEAAPGEKMITKWRYSAFHASDLHTWMLENGRDQLMVCGVYAHIGVLATAQDSFSRDIETFLIADAVADFSARHHWSALEHAAQNCATVTTTEQALAELDASASRVLAHGRP